MIGLGFHNSIDTTLDLNGPFLRYTTQPSLSGDVSNGGSVTLVGVSTAEFKHNPTIPGERVTNTGNIEYQWYIDDVIAVDDGTNISGAGTSELTLSNLTNPDDNGKTAVLYASYNSSAYQSSTPVTAGTARSTGNSPDTPLLSNIVTINVTPVLSITLQPISTTGIEDSLSIFNIQGACTDSTLDGQITYQWRLDGGNLTDDGVNVTGSTTNQLQIKQPEGTYKIDCIVTHTPSDDSPLNSNEVTFISESIKEFVNLETWDSFNISQPFTTTQQNLNDGPLNVIGRAKTGLSPQDGTRSPSVVYFLYAPEADVDVLIEMAAAGGDSFGGIQAGQGGWGCFRMTLEKNVEYAIKLGSNKGQIQPVGGGIFGSPIKGSFGGGLATFYEKNQLLAVLGGGGGAGEISAGGDGGGFNQDGQDGFGRRGGRGGATSAPGLSFNDIFNTDDDRDQRGGSLASCPSPLTDVFRDQGLSQCQDYTISGPGRFKNAASGVEFPTSALLNRGFRPGNAGRLNGGFGLDGGGGGGGGGAVGGSGGEGNGVGGGGGSGWANTGKVTVLRTTSGVNGGDAYFRISLFDSNASIPNPPAPADPTRVRTDWNDPRIPGYKIGDGEQQTKPCG